MQLDTHMDGRISLGPSDFGTGADSVPRPGIYLTIDRDTWGKQSAGNDGVTVHFSTEEFQELGVAGRSLLHETKPPTHFIITAGDYVTRPVGPFTSEEAAHSYYQRNKPQGTVYLTEPTIVRLLRPAPGHEG